MFYTSGVVFSLDTEIRDVIRGEWRVQDNRLILRFGGKGRKRVFLLDDPVEPHEISLISTDRPTSNTQVVDDERWVKVCDLEETHSDNMPWLQVLSDIQCAPDPAPERFHLGPVEMAGVWRSDAVKPASGPCLIRPDGVVDWYDPDIGEVVAGSWRLRGAVFVVELPIAEYVQVFRVERTENEVSIRLVELRRGDESIRVLEDQGWTKAGPLPG